MNLAYRVADVRSAERALMATVPPGTLMARAATGLARRCAIALQDRFGGVYGRHVLLLVGAGDNGGDTLYAGAHLARRGAVVRAMLMDPDRAHEAGLAAFHAEGGRVVSSVPSIVDIAVDGVVGIGGHGPLRAPADKAVKSISGVRATDGGRPTIVAVDLPSGVEADTGVVTDEAKAVRADITVTFGCLKPAHLVGAAATLAGLVDLVDIGLQPYLNGTPALRVPTAEEIASWWPRPHAESDKYTRGVVGLATGSKDTTGAALLGVSGASAGPTGMIRYAGGAAPYVRDAHPAVLVSDRVADAGRVQAWVCGSGLGTDGRARAELRGVLAAKVPVVLDADALTMLADVSTPDFADLLRARHAPLVITPHDREFARVAGAAPGGDRVESALGLAAKMRATVLLKGDRTVVTSPDGTAWVNPTGTPALATGGTGDVLAGLLGSLLAAGLAADRAAIAAAYVHGLAGRAAARHGPVTAVDVAAALPGVVADVLDLG
ncbi:MAG TPA: NAD(P)H-hydrate dehydratase [Micromonosporaceae bacterium]|nr:NAD(P)H-hydrate dehydratase [Micromonosporaceae bacterium]